jgi:Regulator of chromosome condensation (RCC1) repeat
MALISAAGLQRAFARMAAGFSIMAGLGLAGVPDVAQAQAQTPSATTLTQSSTGSSFGQSVTLTARVSGQGVAVPTGNVTFKDGTTSIGIVALTAQGITVTQVAAGSQHSCALSSDGKVYCWGSDGNGALGDGGANTNSLLPVPVSGITNAIAISAFNAGVLAATANSAMASMPAALCR